VVSNEWGMGAVLGVAIHCHPCVGGACRGGAATEGGSRAHGRPIPIIPANVPGGLPHPRPAAIRQIGGLTQYRSIKGEPAVNTVAPASRRCDISECVAMSCVTPARRRCHLILLDIASNSTVLGLARRVTGRSGGTVAFLVDSGPISPRCGSAMPRTVDFIATCEKRRRGPPGPSLPWHATRGGRRPAPRGMGGDMNPPRTRPEEQRSVERR